MPHDLPKTKKFKPFQPLVPIAADDNENASHSTAPVRRRPQPAQLKSKFLTKGYVPRKVPRLHLKPISKESQYEPRETSPLLEISGKANLSVTLPFSMPRESVPRLHAPDGQAPAPENALEDTTISDKAMAELVDYAVRPRERKQKKKSNKKKKKKHRRSRHEDNDDSITARVLEIEKSPHSNDVSIEPRRPVESVLWTLDTLPSEVLKDSNHDATLNKEQTQLADAKCRRKDEVVENRPGLRRDWRQQVESASYQDKPLALNSFTKPSFPLLDPHENARDENLLDIAQEVTSSPLPKEKKTQMLPDQTVKPLAFIPCARCTFHNDLLLSYCSLCGARLRGKPRRGAVNRR